MFDELCHKSRTAARANPEPTSPVSRMFFAFAVSFVQFVWCEESSPKSY